MVKDIISKPLLKTTYIDNRNGDKVLYLEVPERISRSMVVNEVKGSGKHFESTLKYIDKENRSRMVLISAENQELGFIAVVSKTLEKVSLQNILTSLTYMQMITNNICRFAKNNLTSYLQYSVNRLKYLMTTSLHTN